MDNDKKNALWVLIGIVVMAALFMLIGFMAGKHYYNKPFKESIKHDTIIVHDTIPDYMPTPKDSAHIKYVTKWLPSSSNPDTITKWDYLVVHDSVAVEVPITSKHYGNEQYDAYISGFEPSLDSIFVYQKETIITETITRQKSPNKWELDVVGGINYNVSSQRYAPHIGGELMYKPNRLQLGLQGGIVKNEKTEPYFGFKAKLRLF